MAVALPSARNSSNIASANEKNERVSSYFVVPTKKHCKNSTLYQYSQNVIMKQNNFTLMKCRKGHREL